MEEYVKQKEEINLWSWERAYFFVLSATRFDKFQILKRNFERREL